MNFYLAEIARNIAPGAHAVVLLDQAGWRITDKLNVPPTSRSCRCPPNVRVSTHRKTVVPRDNRLSNRVFKSYDDIVDHCCDAWNSLVEQPWRIMSIGLREWAYRFVINAGWYYSCASLGSGA